MFYTFNQYVYNFTLQAYIRNYFSEIVKDAQKNPMSKRLNKMNLTDIDG